MIGFIANANLSVFMTVDRCSFQTDKLRCGKYLKDTMTGAIYVDGVLIATFAPNFNNKTIFRNLDNDKCQIVDIAITNDGALYFATDVEIFSLPSVVASYEFNEFGT